MWDWGWTEGWLIPSWTEIDWLIDWTKVEMEGQNGVTYALERNSCTYVCTDIHAARSTRIMHQAAAAALAIKTIYAAGMQIEDFCLSINGSGSKLNFN